MAIEVIVPKLSHITVTARKSVGALAVKLTVLVLPGIPLAEGIGVGALAVRPTGSRHVGVARRQTTLPQRSGRQTARANKKYKPSLY